MKNLILIAAIFLFVGCSNDDNDKTTENITFTSVGQGALRGSTIKQQNIVIKDLITWEALKKKMNETDKYHTEESLKETDIDFSKFQLIVAFYKQSNSATTIDITKVTMRSGKIFIKIENLQLSVIQNVAQPFHIVKIPKSSKKIVFE
ncbi:hypothetical protein [Flavobacterium sp.]|uniref:hypothetical protein n=1 Tax=Flavobacterium sp. TaxID=239 RepID=UPI002ED7B7C5